MEEHYFCTMAPRASVSYHSVLASRISMLACMHRSDEDDDDVCNWA